MKNMHEKESLVESDLEEGEIPEFEICRNAESEKEEEKNHLTQTHPGDTAFGLMKDNLPVRIPNPTQAGIITNSIYFPSEKGRYELPSVDGEYISEESKPIIRNQVPQHAFYDYNLPERWLKYLHPFQTTYGSVEHIMTKIGETLGRSNDSYYKGRRSNDSRNLIKLNNNIGATFRESSSIFRRIRKNYHKRRRYSESNSDFDKEIWETRLKSRNSTELRRREEKDFKKKRKSKFIESVQLNGETKKYKFPEKTADDSDSTKSKFVGNERLLKGIRELQGKESHETIEEDSKALPESSTSLGEKDEILPSSELINLDDNQENRNCDDFSEKSSINEDSDDDVELIKLRLLALTSNKRKGQSLIDEKLNDIEEKNDENQKTELSEDEKEHENSQVSNDVIQCKTNHDNDIDRYELMLRAEALKTALLKKHKHKIKKHKHSVKISKDDMEKNISDHQELFISQESETKIKDEENSIPVDTDHKMDASVGIITISKNEAISESPENILANPATLAVECMDSNLISESNNQIMRNYIHTRNLAVGKVKKSKLKKIRKFSGLNLKEINFKEKNGIPEVEEDEKAKTFLPDTIIQKKGLEEYEKFVLVDSSQLSKQQSTDETKLNVQNGCKKSVLAKANDLLSATSTPKIPETEIQRIIVHLGSDSSDEESLVQNQLKSGAAASPKESENVEPPCQTSSEAQSRIVDYERSVELLLKDARRRIERNLEAPQRIPPTPEAVYNHLAPSQRLEYIRLKQKIAETEKLRKMKENTTNENSRVVQNCRKNQLKNLKNVAYPTPEIENNQLSVNKVSSSSGNLFSKANSKESLIDTGRSSNRSCIYKNIKKNKNSLRINPLEVIKEGGSSENKVQKEGTFKIKNESGGKLQSKNENSASVVKNILEKKKTITQNRLHLERLKVIWKNIKMEKMIEDKCKNELKRLKIRQNFFELKVSQQRMKIKKLAEESKQIYEAFQRMNKGLEMIGKRKKFVLIEKNCTQNKVENEDFIPQCSEFETVAQVEVISTEPKKEGNLVEKNGTVNLEDREEQTTNGDLLQSAKADNMSDQLKKYNSPLQRLSVGSESLACQRVDPNTIMCQYDLTGRCNDEECPYQHLRS